MSTILRLLATVTVVAGLPSRAHASDHLRFADLTLPSEVSEKLLHVGRALAPDDVARQLAQEFPDLHLVVMSSNLAPDPQKLRWRDARVGAGFEQYYAASGWLSGTLERYLPAGYVPFGARPLMNHDLLLVRDYAPRDVLISGAVKYAIGQRLKNLPGRQTFVELQDDAFDATDSLEDDPVKVARLMLATLRLSSLQEVDVGEWLLNHRRDLRLTPLALKSIIAHVSKMLDGAVLNLDKVLAAAPRGALDQDVRVLRGEIYGVLQTLRVVGCELLL